MAWNLAGRNDYDATLDFINHVKEPPRLITRDQLESTHTTTLLALMHHHI
jgi:hypothetical protein